MTKLIRLTEEVYNELEEFRGKRETFSQAVERLLSIIRPIKEASGILGPNHYLMKRMTEDVR